MRPLRLALTSTLCLLPCLAGAQALDEAAGLRSSFDAQPGDAVPVLSTYGAEPGPSLEGGALGLLHGAKSQQNVAAFACTAEGPQESVLVGFSFHIDEGADGFALALLSTDKTGKSGPGPELPAWEEPNIPGAFAVGFDIYNPPTDNPFDANGNIHRREQREVSLHWDGAEVANALSPVEFRGEGFHRAAVELRFVLGGALATVRIDDRPVYDNRFIAGLQPYESRICLGARTGGISTSLLVDDLAVSYGARTEPRRPTHTVRAFDGEVIHSGNREPTRTVELPELSEPPGRIVLTLTLQAPPGGFDPWDRSAAVYVWDGDERYELCRYITPYGRGHSWKVDVTDYQSLLRGERKMGLFTDTWVGGETPQTTKGWRVTVDLDYYPGPPERVPLRVVNLWSGQPEYGNPEAPLDAFFEPRLVAIAAEARRAKLRLMVTGHGQNPASQNAAEFLPADRTVTVNGKTFQDRLWKTDCYLNPCRPQGGTWKYDRAGWAPGDVVTPWEIDLTDVVQPGHDCTVTYQPMPYVNDARDKARASHWVEVQLIEYGE